MKIPDAEKILGVMKLPDREAIDHRNIHVYIAVVHSTHGWR
jgi:hypothetical protein